MVLRRQLNESGHTDHEIRSEVRAGSLRRLRRGAYLGPGGLSPEATHRELVVAALGMATRPAVVSHVSAAVLHGLPVDRRRLDRVHLLRPGDSRSEGRGPVVRHTRSEVVATEVDGIAVTPLAVTAVDLARQLPFRDGVAVADAVLARGVPRSELQALVEQGRGRHGNWRAHRVVEFADGRSESAGESHSRARILEAGLPVPELQFVLIDAAGEMRSDFVWQERRVLGEFDGRIKYGRLLRGDRDADEVLVAERRREIRLERLGWTVIRLCWSDLTKVATVRGIVEAGFARAARRG